MKICIINNLYKPFNRGGAERIAELQAAGLKKAGHEVFIISTRPYFKSVSDSMQNVYYLPGIFYSLGNIPKLFRLAWHFYDIFDIFNYSAVRAILKKEKPDLVITNNLKGIGFLIPRAIKKLRIKHVHILHDIQLLHPSGLMMYGQEKITDSYFSKIYQKIVNSIFGSPDIVSSPSKWLLDLHLGKSFFKSSKITVIPNPIDLNEPESEKKINEHFKFFYAGQIEKHKGILFLIDAFNSFSKYKNADLLIAGSGKEIERAKKNANKNILFLGKLPLANLMDEMRSSRCLIIPSLCYENSPGIIYEAASAGIPVIASRIGGIPELTHVLGGILIEPGNEKDLIKKMEWAMYNPEKLKEMGESARKKIKEYSVENYIKKLISIN